MIPRSSKKNFPEVSGEFFSTDGHNNSNDKSLLLDESKYHKKDDPI
ncbi:unnamed protein product [uncultured virus]|nr:unnamed protein product [uncultured virus]